MSVNYKIAHMTCFDYPIPVSVCHNIVCLTPKTNSRLSLKQTELSITPNPTVVSQRTDRFGNVTYAFSIEEPHDALTVEATAQLMVSEQQAISVNDAIPSWEEVAQSIADQTDLGWRDAAPFVFDSPLVSRTPESVEMGAQLFTPGRPITEVAQSLNALIHSEFEYKPGSTHVNTTSSEAIRNRYGVCQDFAHAMLATLRSFRLPARYVSGYLRTIPPPGRPKLVGVDQSHAWIEVYMGASIGWVELDPTNNMRCGVDHIPIASGRDYSDIAPIRGAFLGGGESRLSVSVDVQACESPERK